MPNYNFLTNSNNDILCPAAYAKNLQLGSISGTLENYVSNYIKSMIESVYPISSLYFNTTGINPSTELGFGTWVAEAAGRSIMSSGSSVDTHGMSLKITSDGAVWARILYQSTYFPSKNDVFNGYDSGDGKLFSALQYLEEFYSKDEDLEFLLEYPKISARWRQRGHPRYEYYDALKSHTTAAGYLATDPVNPSNSSVETGLYVPWSTNWGGLVYTTATQSALCGNVAVCSNYHYPVGQISAYSSVGLVGASSSSSTGVDGVASISLWVRWDNVSGMYDLLETGGKMNVTLDVSKLANHRHTTGRTSASGGSAAYDVGYGTELASQYLNSIGGGQAHNNMQPYKVVYIWKRIS